MVWDVTCVDTLAASYLNATSKKAGSAAERACAHKHDHTTKKFIDVIGRMLIDESSDVRASHYLKNRILLVIQQGNAVSVLGTHPSNTRFDEIHIL